LAVATDLSRLVIDWTDERTAQPFPRKSSESRLGVSARVIERVFIPLRSATVGLLFAAIWYAVLPTVQLFVSTMIATVVAAFAYEWVHYLTHTSYRPRTAFYRRMWRNHRLHHFKNEHYWA